MKKISRRSFLQITGLAAGASMLPMPVKWLGTGQAEAFMQTPTTVNKLYGGTFRVAEIPIAIPIPQPAADALGAPQLAEGAIDDVADAGLGWLLKFPKQFPPSRAPYGAPKTGVRHYTFTNQDFQDRILPDAYYPATGVGAKGTTLYGFKPALTLLEGLTFLGVDYSILGLPKYSVTGTRQPQKHLGGIMLWEGGPSGKPVQFTMVNNLPLKHILPNDLTVPGANQGDDRWTTHVHGGLMPWICDGGPFDWYSSVRRAPAARRVGSAFINNVELQEGAAINSMTQGEFYMNPDKQSARMIWYHDHAFGITRINAYAGAASAILIRDDFERALIPDGLPPLLENSLTKILGANPDPIPPVIQELPIVFQDKIFVGNNIKTSDPTWPGPTYPGTMWYPHTYEGTRWRRLPVRASLPQQSVVAEMFGDTMLVNGSYSPTLTVEPRRYRFRLLNACNARFLNLQLYVAQYGVAQKAAPYADNLTGITLDGVQFLDAPINLVPNPAYQTPVNAPFVNAVTGDSSWLVMGYECGFLTSPQKVPCNQYYVGGDNSGLEKNSLLLGSAERPDVIVDFSNYAGQDIILYNDAAGPFPGSAGDPRNDYFPGLDNGNVVNTGRNRPANDLAAHNTRCIMRFRVAATATAPADKTWNLPVGQSLVARENPALGQIWNMEPERFDQKLNAAYTIVDDGSASTGGPNWLSIDGVKIDRFNKLGLFEEFDLHGRLQQDVGALTSGATAYTAVADPTGSDFPVNGNCEVWAIWNTTADVHPMHFHMSNWWIIGRQPFDGALNPVSGMLMGPRNHELGYKEVVLCYPGEITYIMDKWNIPPIYGPKLATTAGDLTTVRPFEPAYSPRGELETDPQTNLPLQAHETVWHCHILEHEEHDMMRPVWIKGITSVSVTSGAFREDAPVIKSVNANQLSLATPTTLTISGLNLVAATVVVPGFTTAIVSQSNTSIQATFTSTTAVLGHSTGTLSIANGNKDFFYVKVVA